MIVRDTASDKSLYHPTNTSKAPQMSGVYDISSNATFSFPTKTTIKSEPAGLTYTVNDQPTDPTPTPAPPTGGNNGMVQTQPTQAAADPMINSYDSYINAMYEAQRQRELAALENEYNAAIAEIEREKAAVAPAYQGARNQTAGNNAREMQAMNEMMTAAGLSSGGRAQGAIAQSNVLQSNLSALEQAEAQALADIEAKRTQVATQYQGRVREAIMNNEMEKAAALYEEAIRYDNALVDNAKQAAQLMAGIGDYSLYGQFLGLTDAQVKALNDAAKPKYTGTKLAEKTPTLTIAQALERAENGDMSYAVRSVLYEHGYNDSDLGTYYGYEPVAAPAGNVTNDEFYSDFLTAVKAGDSSYDLNKLISSARASGTITNEEAVQLRGAYVGGR